MPVDFINITLILALLGISIAVMFIRCIPSSIILFGVFSLTITCIHILLGAPDVAITEAAVGSGMSTALMFAAVSLIKDKEGKTVSGWIVPTVGTILTFCCMMYAVRDVPEFGAKEKAVNVATMPYYTSVTRSEIGVPNMVSAILADFRSYDTLCETAVVFIAALGVKIILGTKEPGCIDGDKTDD